MSRQFRITDRYDGAFGSVLLLKIQLQSQPITTEATQVLISCTGQTNQTAGAYPLSHDSKPLKTGVCWAPSLLRDSVMAQLENALSAKMPQTPQVLHSLHLRETPNHTDIGIKDFPWGGGAKGQNGSWDF